MSRHVFGSELLQGAFEFVTFDAQVEGLAVGQSARGGAPTRSTLLKERRGDGEGKDGINIYVGVVLGRWECCFDFIVPGGGVKGWEMDDLRWYSRAGFQVGLEGGKRHEDTSVDTVKLFPLVVSSLGIDEDGEGVGETVGWQNKDRGRVGPLSFTDDLQWTKTRVR